MSRLVPLSRRVCGLTVVLAIAVIFSTRIIATQVHPGMWVQPLQAVLTTSPVTLAYDFSTTNLGSQWLATFHAEPHKNPTFCHGDSVAVKYSTSSFWFGQHCTRR